MARDLKEDFFRFDGAWASFELMSIRRREDYLRPFKILRCKIDDQVDFQASEALRSTTEATVRIESFGDEALVVASGHGPVHASDNAMRKMSKSTIPSLPTCNSKSLTCACCTALRATLRRAAPAPWSESWRFFPTVQKDGERSAWPQTFFRPASSA